jgi:hypothetical protein
MLEKCSNPDCDSPFDYCEGRLIRFSPTDTYSSERTRNVEHCWLCGECSERYLFAFERAGGMKIRLYPAAMRTKFLQSNSVSTNWQTTKERTITCRPI